MSEGGSSSSLASSSAPCDIMLLSSPCVCPVSVDGVPGLQSTASSVGSVGSLVARSTSVGSVGSLVARSTSVGSVGSLVARSTSLLLLGVDLCNY